MIGSVSLSPLVYPLSAEFASMGVEIYCDFCSKSIALDIIEVLWTLSFAGLKEASQKINLSALTLVHFAIQQIQF